MTAASTTKTPMTHSKWFLVAIITAGVVAWLGWHHYHDTLVGPTDHSSSIAQEIGADSCAMSEYTITNKLAGSETPIYNCMMADGNYKCVTRENGIDQDQTDEVKFLFESTLGSGKPACIGG